MINYYIHLVKINPEKNSKMIYKLINYLFKSFIRSSSNFLKFSL